MRNEENNGPTAAERSSTSTGDEINSNNFRNGEKISMETFEKSSIFTGPSNNNNSQEINSSSVVNHTTTSRGEERIIEIIPKTFKTVDLTFSDNSIQPPPKISVKPKHDDEILTDDDANLRDSMAELTALADTSSCSDSSEKLRKSIKNTFFGGVRFFASMKNDEIESDETEENPFESTPKTPRFVTIHKGRKSYSKTDDNGEKPYALFGDIESKVNPEELDWCATKLTQEMKEKVDFEVFVSLEKLDKSLDEALAKPASWLSINHLVARPQKAKRGGSQGQRSSSSMMADIAKTVAKVAAAAGGGGGGTPRKRPQIENMPPEDQRKADFESTRGYCFAPGTRVFAKWMDMNCYPGNVIAMDSIGRYKVRFLDGEVRDVISNWVICLSQIKVGDNLMVSVPSEENGKELVFQPATVTARPDIDVVKDWHEGIYEVDNSVKQTKEKISWEKFVLEVDQAKEYVAERNNKIAQEPGSLAENKEQRRTRGKRPKMFLDSSYDDDDEDDLKFYEDDDDDMDASGRRRREFNKPRRKQRRRTMNDDEIAPSTAKVNFAKLPVQIMTSTSAHPQRNVWPRRQQVPPRQMLRPGNRAEPPVLDPQQPKSAPTTPAQPAKPKFSETLLVIKPYQSSNQQRGEPINRSMFANMRFVLTSATRPKDSNASEEEDAPPPVPFNKRQIRMLIEERSGFIVDDFAHVTDLSNCYLIADTHYRTHKYLSALVRAVPCVSHMWIFECVKENRLVPQANFMLPAGKSLETNQIIPWHDKCLTLLNGIKMFVHTEKEVHPNAIDFTQIWAPIARSMGAILVDSLPESSEDPLSKFDILLTDSSCSPEIVARAKALNATPVSSEWLIQAMLTGVLPSTSGHAKYQYDYVETVDMP